jgi:hypothetical protein
MPPLALFMQLRYIYSGKIPYRGSQTIKLHRNLRGLQVVISID